MQFLESRRNIRDYPSDRSCNTSRRIATSSPHETPQHTISTNPSGLFGLWAPPAVLSNTATTSSVSRDSMARSVSRRRVVVRQSYYWPDQQLNFWILVMLATGGTLIGVFASFIVDQHQLGLGIPWSVAKPTTNSNEKESPTDDYDSKQDNALRHSRRLPHRAPNNRHAPPHLPTPPPPGRRHDRLLHPPRPLHHRPNRNRDPGLRPARRHQRPLPNVRLQQRVPRPEHEHARLARAEQHLPELAGRLRLLDHRRRVFDLDDCFGVYGGEGRDWRLGGSGSLRAVRPALMMIMDAWVHGVSVAFA